MHKKPHHHRSAEHVQSGVARIYKSKKIESYVVLIVLAFCAYAIGELAFFKRFGISALIIAVALGAVIGNFAHHNVSLLKKTGALGVCTKQILRAGIVLYGFRISLHDIAGIGLSGVALAAFMVFSTFLLGLLIGRILRIDGLSAALIAAGSSICGAAAVLASESVLKGGAQRVGVAVCTVVVFGSLGMFIYPAVQGLFSMDSHHYGLIVGASLHEVAHVAGAASSIGEAGGKAAVVEKMMRVVMLVPFLLALVLFRRQKGASLASQIPWFAFGFLAVCLLSSTPWLQSDWAIGTLKPAIEKIDTFLLALSMVALGVNIRKDMLSAAGARPFVMALLLCGWLFGASYGFVALFC